MESRRPVNDVLPAHRVSENVARSVDFDGPFRCGIGEVQRDAVTATPAVAKAQTVFARSCELPSRMRLRASTAMAAKTV